MDLASLSIGNAKATWFAVLLIAIGDIGDVQDGNINPTTTLMRFDGRPAIGVAMSFQPSVNVVGVGKAVGSFLISLAQAVATVLVDLTVVMGHAWG